MARRLRRAEEYQRNVHLDAREQEQQARAARERAARRQALLEARLAEQKRTYQEQRQQLKQARQRINDDIKGATNFERHARRRSLQPVGKFELLEQKAEMHASEHRRGRRDYFETQCEMRTHRERVYQRGNAETTAERGLREKNNGS